MAVGDEAELCGEVVGVEGHGGVGIEAGAGENLGQAAVVGSDGLAGLDGVEEPGEDGDDLVA